MNLSAIVGKSAGAKERRLVPEVSEDFFTHAAPIVGVQQKIGKLGDKPGDAPPQAEQAEVFMGSGRRIPLPG